MSSNNIYEKITGNIIEQLGNSVIPWKKPWVTPLPLNLKTGKPYRGINLLALWDTEYTSPYWLTYKQARSLGGTVKFKEKGTSIVFWKWIEKKESAEGTEPLEQFPIIKQYTVFNLDQCKRVYPPENTREPCLTPLEVCENIVEAMPHRPETQHGGVKAFYCPSKDFVRVPCTSFFKDIENYYATLFHELGHATGHSSRLSRKLVGKNSLDHETYSEEELIAELSSCFLCAEAGISSGTIDNSVAYIKGWLKKLKNDPKFVVQAAGQAQKAVDFILEKFQEDE